MVRVIDMPNYFPDTLETQRFYEPVERGLEIRIRERLLELRRQNNAAKNKG
jgi:putative ATPase